MPVTVGKPVKNPVRKRIVYYLEVSVSSEPNMVTGVAEAIDEMRGWGRVEILDVETREEQEESEK